MKSASFDPSLYFGSDGKADFLTRLYNGSGKFRIHLSGGTEMLKRIGIPGIALAAMLTLFGPSKADARARFGVYFGPPAYTVYQPYPYVYPGYYYGYREHYYTYPEYGFSFGWHHHHHERWEHHRGWRR